MMNGHHISIEIFRACLKITKKEFVCGKVDKKAVAE
jgi:hypothetical protein